MKIIVVEGCDGAGKSTQVQLLKEYLESVGVKCRYIKFPNYWGDSSALVRMYLNGEIYKDNEHSNHYAASLFYACDRHITMYKYMESNPDENEVVICDRYIGSNAIHQMIGIDKDKWDEYIEWLYDTECGKLGIPEETMTIYLDVSNETSDKLLSKRYMGDEEKRDIIEKDREYTEKCRESGKYIAYKKNWYIIKCDEHSKLRGIEDIHNEIKDDVNKALNM